MCRSRSIGIESDPNGEAVARRLMRLLELERRAGCENMANSRAVLAGFSGVIRGVAAQDFGSGGTFRWLPSECEAIESAQAGAVKKL